MDIRKTTEVAEREDAGVTIHLRDAAGEKQYKDEKQTVPVTMQVAGTYSKRYKRAQDANRDKLLKQRRREVEGDELEAQSIDLVATCILGWDGLTADGEPFPYSKANAIALLTAAPWVREQVETAMHDHAAFFR